MVHRPYYPSVEEVARWHANKAAEAKVVADRAEALKKEFGEEFGRGVGPYDGENVRTLKIEKMAQLYAERNTKPHLVDAYDRRAITEKAMSHALYVDHQQMINDEGPYAGTAPDIGPTETPDQLPEKGQGRSGEPLEGPHSRPVEARAAIETAPAPIGARPGTPEGRPAVDREQGSIADRAGQSQPDPPERGPLAPPAHQAAADPLPGAQPDPAHQSAAVPDPAPAAPQPEAGPSPQRAETLNEFDMIEELRRVVQGLESAPVPSRGPSAPGGQETEPGAMPAPADQTAPEPVPSEPRRLRFYEDLKLEHARAVGNDNAKPGSQAQEATGGKALSFHEDQTPPGQDLSH